MTDLSSKTGNQNKNQLKIMVYIQDCLSYNNNVQKARTFHNDKENYNEF